MEYEDDIHVDNKHLNGAVDGDLVIVEIINKNVDFINDLCPLYECIGYVIYLESDIARIEFKGSYIYDIYKDFSYEILNSDIPDWRSVEDGYNINMIHNPNWMEEIK